MLTADQDLLNIQGDAHVDLSEWTVKTTDKLANGLCLCLACETFSCVVDPATSLPETRTCQFCQAERVVCGVEMTLLDQYRQQSTPIKAERKKKTKKAKKEKEKAA